MKLEDELFEKSDFDRLLDGDRPMLAYYKAVGEDYHYRDRIKFRSASRDGTLAAKKIMIQNEGQSFRMIYEIYSKPNNEWRLDLYCVIKRIGQTVWNADLEEIENTLLGLKL